MHFLGAVIAEKQDDIYGILAEWSEYADVDEYVKETRSEIIANGRADDQAYLEDHGNDTDPMHEKFKKAAAGRLALDDEAALKAYAEYRRLNLNEDGDAVSTFNEDSFYDYYEIGEWEGVDALRGITCRELADRYNREDALARTAIGSLCVICKEGWYDGRTVERHHHSNGAERTRTEHRQEGLVAQLPRLTARRAGVLPSEDAGQEPTSPHMPCAGWKSAASSSHRRTLPERLSPPASRSSDWAASMSC